MKRKRSKQVWTDERRLAAAERMRKMRAEQLAWKGEAGSPVADLQTVSTATVAVLEQDVAPVESDTEFQARRAREKAERLASYGFKTDDQERLAKLAGAQARVLGADPKAQEAVKRHELAKEQVLEVRQDMAAPGAPAFGIPLGVPPSRIGSRELSLIVKTDGTMASLNGPCVCGAGKREWHAICLREVQNVA